MPCRLVTLLLAVLCLGGCSREAAETPTEGLEAILALYQAEDYDALIRTRYAELHKAESAGKVDELVAHFRQRLAEEGELTRAITAYRAALKVEPELSEEGTVARFNLESGFIKLSRMSDGRWGFHL